MMPGDNAPPMHPNCRCSVAAAMSDEEFKDIIDIDKIDIYEDNSDIPNKLKRLLYEKYDQRHDILPITIDELPDSFASDITSIIDKAPRKIKNIINIYHGKIRFINLNPKNGNKLIKNGIRVNISKDKNGVRGAYTGTFHEIGHYIDRLQGYISEDANFSNALFSDFNSLVNNLISTYNVNNKEAYQQISDVLKSDPIFHSSSDIIDGITRGECKGNYTHANSYWDDERKLGHEAFAHFFEAYARNDQKKLEILSALFPEGYQYFLHMLDDMQ